MKKILLVVMILLSWAFVAEAQDVGKQISNLVDAYAQLGKFNGSILVAAKGKVLLNKGYGFKDVKEKTVNDANTVYQIASVTKTFTSTLVLKLVEMEKIALTDNVAKFYPGFPQGDSITIAQLLSHTSGISDDSSADRVKNQPDSTEELFIATLKARKLDFSPGTDWKYSNSGYILLGYIIERVLGMTYYEAIRTYIFQPLQMNASAFDFVGLASPDKATGYWAFPESDTVRPATLIDYRAPRAAGAIYSTTGDLYTWHRGLQTGKLISLSLLDKAYTPVRNQYGLGWIIDSVGTSRVVSHSGDIWGFKSELTRVPADDICIIQLNNIEDVDLRSITRKILAILYHQPYQLPARNEIQLSQPALREYEGDYLLRPGEWIKVRVENARLMATTNRKQELYAQRNGVFKIDDGYDQIVVTFHKGASGKVTELSFTIGGNKIICKKRVGTPE
ncbi:serine hydrolase domain-containing protein [Larkinella insperata]|uniref:Serine hydrolase domain-containing protein n=1 Tax=Larkinella insperata TaxID=332158 RepID=A0ABW3QDA4_9BACT